MGYSDKHFLNLSPPKTNFFWEKKEKRVQTFTTFTISVSARVRFLRFWRNKLTADALTVCLCVFRDAHKNSSPDLRTLIYLDDNASINSVPVENRPAHKYLCWVFPWRAWFIYKTMTAHVKSHLGFAQMGFHSKLLSPRFGDIAIASVRLSRYLLLNHWLKFNQIWCVSCSHE